MSKLVWDKTGERIYETGVRNGVLYPQVDGAYPKGVAWNGLIAVTESPSGAEASPFYADDFKYFNLMSAEDFGGTIEAYTYPDEYKPCIGEVELVAGINIGQQTRQTFGFCYRTVIGNDTENDSHGYKLHLIYGALASVSEKAYTSINDSPEPIAFSWEFTTTPVEVDGYKPTAILTIDSTKVGKENLEALEAVLYGSDNAEPRMPTPDEIVDLIGENAG